MIQLKSLNLSENNLTKLPKDLRILASLSEININGNPFEDIRGVADSLRTVGPNLRSLHVHLFEEDDAKYLCENLESLQILNGLEVERGVLETPEGKAHQEAFLAANQRVISKEEEAKNDKNCFKMKIHKIKID